MTLICRYSLYTASKLPPLAFRRLEPVCSVNTCERHSRPDNDLFMFPLHDQASSCITQVFILALRFNAEREHGH